MDMEALTRTVNKLSSVFWNLVGLVRRTQHKPNGVTATSATKPAISPGHLQALRTPDRALWRSWKWPALCSAIPNPFRADSSLLLCEHALVISVPLNFASQRLQNGSDE